MHTQSSSVSDCDLTTIIITDSIKITDKYTTTEAIAAYMAAGTLVAA
jgi:hypothetical protein